MLILSQFIVALLLTSTTASAVSYSYPPTKIRLMTASLVVVGTLGKVKQVDRDASGTLTITSVLVGDSKIKTAKLRWRDMSPFGGSRGHEDGQTGIWILGQVGNGSYTTGYPGNFFAMSALKDIKQLLTEIADLKWTKVNGLELVCITMTRKNSPQPAGTKAEQEKPNAMLRTFPVVRNASKKMLRVYDNINDRTFDMTLVAPSGIARTIELYQRLDSSRKIHENLFSALAPGELRMIGYGLSHAELWEEGKYLMKLSYGNKQNGSQFDLKDVWTGKIDLPEQNVWNSPALSPLAP